MKLITTYKLDPIWVDVMAQDIKNIKEDSIFEDT